MNTNDYLSNPVLQRGFYNCKCVEVETLRGQNLPIVMIRLKIVPYEAYGAAQNTVLYATLRDSAAAQQMHERFRQTFQVEDEATEAIGRFGSVLVDADEFKGRKYGGVHFIAQNPIVRRQAAELERADRAGEIPWVNDEDADAA